MSEMVERVARAIAAAEGYDIDGLKAYVDSSSVSKKDYERLMAKARAAIEAMRESIPSMLAAGESVREGVTLVEGHRPHTTSGVFAAMIDAALTE